MLEVQAQCFPPSVLNVAGQVKSSVPIVKVEAKSEFVDKVRRIVGIGDGDRGRP